MKHWATRNTLGLNFPKCIQRPSHSIYALKPCCTHAITGEALEHSVFQNQPHLGPVCAMSSQGRGHGQQVFWWALGWGVVF